MQVQSRVGHPSRDPALSSFVRDSQDAEDEKHRNLTEVPIYRTLAFLFSDLVGFKGDEEQEQTGSMHDHLNMTSKISGLAATNPKSYARYDNVYH